MIPSGREFWKLSGSGNDFVFVDTRSQPAGSLAQLETIRAICSRGTGIGADGIVFLEPSRQAAVKMAYINADGTRADLCGNATLCTARMARELGIVGDAPFTIETDVGVLGARFPAGSPEIDLQPVTELRPDAGLPLEKGEIRMGFALAGVPHLSILVDDLEEAGKHAIGVGATLAEHQAQDDVRVFLDPVIGLLRA